MKNKKLSKIQSDWVNDLITGRFRQVQDQLARKMEGGHVGYCCLGVACVVAKRHGIELKKTIDHTDIRFNGLVSDLPVEILKELKLMNSTGKLKRMYKGYRSLAEMNDGGMTHVEIGEYIKANKTNVFKF